MNGELLGQTLLRMGVVNADQVHIALREQRRSAEPLGRLLVRLGFVAETTLRDALAEFLGRPSVDLTTLVPDPAALALVPHELARHCGLIPLSFDAVRRVLVVASAGLGDIVALDPLRAALPSELHIDTMLAGESQIARAIDRLYGHELSIDGILHEIETGEAGLHTGIGDAHEYAQPVVRLIDALLIDAVKSAASDIHFEPESAFLRIRYRTDGLLRPVRALHKSCWPSMAVRLKVMAGLDIAETRSPQDGHISLNVSGRPVDFRIATQPTLHGENIVLRILDRQRGIVPLDGLGLASAQLDSLKRMIARPEGLILVTGPTGSGKTTTLYSILSHINAESIHIMTLEDPVEYPMPLIRQTSVNEAAHLDFGNGVRAMLRQDPDVILIGEIRDADSARMALQAAMTGHQVYSTLHCNSAIGAIPRLLDIGIQPGILAGNIIGIVAQRLLRKLCPACRTPYTADRIDMARLGAAPDAPPAQLYRPAGCARCDFRGYSGRMAIMELLRFDEELDELVARRANPRELRHAARAGGFSSLAESGSRCVLEGLSSVEELARVVDLTGRMS